MHVRPSTRRPTMRRLGALTTATALAAALAVPTFVSQDGDAANASDHTAAGVALAEDSGPPTWPQVAGNGFGPAGPGTYDPDSRGSAGDYDGLEPADEQAAATVGLDVTDATAAQSVGVVLVSSVVDFGAGEAAGTGMVIDGTDGIVVTNHHVVEGSTEVTVTDPTSGEAYAATVLGTDAVHDVAVLQLDDAPTLAEVSGATTGVTVGDAVVAVGDAGGDGGALTAAAGTVTDAHEPVTVTEDDGTESTIRNLIEVDADIISGDSGGALLDASGDVVGMNVAASSGAADITGYAIPIRRVLRIADDILAGDEGGAVTLGYDAFLGVQLGPTSASAVVAGVVDGSAAARAGLSAGDTITALGGDTISTTDALSDVIAQHDVGDRTTLRWTDAAGGDHGAEVTLGRAPVA